MDKHSIETRSHTFQRLPAAVCIIITIIIIIIIVILLTPQGGGSTAVCITRKFSICLTVVSCQARRDSKNFVPRACPLLVNGDQMNRARNRCDQCQLDFRFLPEVSISWKRLRCERQVAYVPDILGYPQIKLSSQHSSCKNILYLENKHCLRK